MGCGKKDKIVEEIPQNDTSTTNSNLVVIPDIVDIDETTAKSVLAALGLVPLIIEEYNYVTIQGSIIRTEPIVGSEVKLGDKIKLYKSKGPNVIHSKNATWRAWWISGSDGDDYLLYAPFIEENTLMIDMEVTFNSTYSMEWQDEYNSGVGYGNVSLIDTVDKTIPFTIKYEKRKIVKGEKQNIRLEIPLNNLNIERPTDIYTKWALDINGEFEYLSVDFTITW